MMRKGTAVRVVDPDGVFDGLEGEIAEYVPGEDGRPGQYEVLSDIGRLWFERSELRLVDQSTI
jgi:hypothetical protein